ncbi:hypothetical protein RDWZM_009412 [Blomia tropicalis]|uniref:Serpin domain-containing protein n=1 Tax=Blomia tropicalis TaxID=40697 RepID=A0A9Q0M6G6_BLOTA|nr:hypothetical protein RDWZM_009412 [Blomia tropicalis]
MVAAIIITVPHETMLSHRYHPHIRLFPLYYVSLLVNSTFNCSFDLNNEAEMYRTIVRIPIVPGCHLKPGPIVQNNKCYNDNLAIDLEHINLDAKEIWSRRAHILATGARTSTDKTMFDLLSKLVIQSDKDLKEQFVTLSKDNYPTNVYKMAALTVDNQRDETKKINEWFLEKSSTNQIGRMLDDNELTSDIKLLSLNGAGFKGAWKGNPFDTKDTKDDTFNNVDGKTSKIAFMYAMNKPFRMVKEVDDKILAIELPFTDHEGAEGHKHGTKLVVIMPTDDNTVDKTIDSLEREKLTNLMDKLFKSDRKKPEQLKFPKLNFEKDYELKEALSELNVKGLFSQADANFSQMVQGTDLSKPEIFLSQLDHKAVIQWTEDSDKKDDSEPMPSSNDESVAIDKPFIFFIVDKPMDEQIDKPMIIFAGRIKTLTKDTAFSFN